MSTTNVVQLRARRDASLEEQRAVLVRQLRAMHQRCENSPAELLALITSPEYDELHLRITALDFLLL